jgi:ferredoxin
MARFPRFRIFCEYARSLFDPNPPEEPSEPSFRGRPVFAEEGCVGCGACAAVCPSGAIRIVDLDLDEDRKNDIPMRRIELAYDRCHFCGRCEAACVTGRGIRFLPEDPFALFDRSLAVESVEKAVTLCAECGVVIAAADHIRWVRDRLGLTAYGNPLLIMADEPVVMSKGNFRPLCARCRFELKSGG